MKEDIVLIDGDCPSCNRFAVFAMKRDATNALRFAPLNGITSFSYFKKDVPLDSMRVITPLGVLEKSDAALNVLSKLRFPWNLLALARIMPVAARDWCYDLWAKNRIKLTAHQDSCALLSEQEKLKFLP